MSSPHVIIIQRGGQFFAHFGDFYNLMESPAGFGSTEEAALGDLRRVVGNGWPSLREFEGTHPVKLTQSRKVQGYEDYRN